MDNFISICGKLEFDPVNRTKKHKEQSSWKKTAMLMLDGDMHLYYGWLIKRRYGIELNRPLRGSHVTFVNDKMRDDALWNKVRDKWNGKEISIQLDVNAKTNSDYWWLKVVDGEGKQYFDKVRKELGLGEPFFSYHMTIGWANEKNIDQSRYIHGLLKKQLSH